MLRATFRGAALTVGMAAAVSGCSGSQPSSAPSSASSTTSKSSASTSSSTSDAPIGSGGIDLGGSASSTSYPADQLSLPGATDCYASGTRIYDRHGVTCAQAKTALAEYNASAAGAKGQSQKVGRYTCSHNPRIMVEQGAAPGSCLDDTQSVVFNWRYPGAPQPARG